ncbi:MAG: M20/M25/M40 family metallo-hydrolase [Acidobacteria bacterium]|nr:M20/M25/M40 family metallo-hydrolase [Acidobacteriota bacterium]
MKRRLACVISAIVTCTAVTAGAQTTADWQAIGTEAVRTIQEYVRINTSNPPGDVLKAADFLTRILEREGIPVKRYDSGPGRSIVLARLKGTGPAKPLLLLNHMDVVPTDPARWQHDPFAAEIVDGKMWGRGTIDMKGLGVVQLMAFLSLKRQNVPLARDVILMAVPDEETGGTLGARWMRTEHYADIDPEYILDEGGFGSRDLFAPGKLVFGISVAEKKILWLKLTAEGVAGHGSQPHDQNPNDRLVRALSRLLNDPLPSTSFTVLDTMKSRVGTFAVNKFNNAIQHSTISLTSLRSGVGDPPKVNVIPSLAEATIDCRVLPGTSKDQWMTEIRRRLADPAIKMEITYEGDDPVVTTQDSTFYRALESAVKRRHPDAIVTPMVVPYGTDANGFRPLGVKSYGFTPIVVPADAVMSMHGDAEYLPVDAVAPAIQILFEALRDTAAK